ncbi:MAG: mandelate racemase/muconate lactonizing enzyme family protein [Pseudomonadota bacterium]
MPKISSITVTPLRLPLKKPYVWSQGVEEAFTVNLIALTCEDGTVGYGETTTAPDANAQKLVLEKISAGLIGQDIFDIDLSFGDVYRQHFLAFGANMPRYFAQMSSGLEMALLDARGKVLGVPVWSLLGGPRREDVGYFYFLQGETPEALAEDARKAVSEGHPIIYLKVGVGEAHDLAAVKAVREAIGDARLRLDANEAWSPDVALRMMARLAPYDVEYLEQPTPSASQAALGHVAAKTDVAIGADQSIFTLQEVFTACTTHRVDMIAIGPREIGGLFATLKAAAVAEAAGLKLCIHSSMTTGITACAEHHLGRAIPNLDDANQIMWQLLERDIVASPDLRPKAGRLSLPPAPGLGFELDWDVVGAAAELHRNASA